MTTPKLIIYHDRCFDGLGAAWAAQQLLDWSTAELWPGNHTDADRNDAEVWAERVAGRDVLIVDFCYPRNVLLKMASTAKSVTVIDHHKTAQEDLEGLEAENLTIHFDMNRSGAGLTWDVLLPGSPLPMVIDYIEDRDLWLHALPYAAEVQAWMRVYPSEIASIEHLAKTMEATGVVDGFGNPTSIVQTGAALLAYRKRIIEDATRDAVEVVLDGHLGRMVNFGINEIYSEVAEAVGHGYDFGLAWKRMPGEKVLLSFRSTTTDVSKLARVFGGGGHANAAGAQPSWDDFVRMLLRPGGYVYVTQCAACGADFLLGDVHCYCCGASPNVVVPVWFAQGTRHRDESRLKAIQKAHEELHWLRSLLPIPDGITAINLKRAGLYAQAGIDGPFDERDWSVELRGTSVMVKADTEDEARRLGANALSWLPVKS